ncbi:MAG: DUF421 domain-containing protein [Actinomycetota bacterium]
MAASSLSAMEIFAFAWMPLVAAAGATALVYVFLIAAIRIFGRRQTGQLTVVDLIVVLLLGSAVETAMIHGNTSLLVALVSASTLLVMNRILTFALLRSKRLRHIVNGGPVLLVNNGQFIEEHLHRTGMTKQDAEEAIRERGYASASDVRYAILETDGTVSVIPLAH